jgi:hypothetical protein
MDIATILAEKIERLGPGQAEGCGAAITLADAGYSLSAGFRQVLGVTVPPELSQRATLAARCDELCRGWLPLVDLETLRQLEQRARDREQPLDGLLARKAQLRKPRTSHKRELAAFRKLPPLDGYTSVEALWIEDRMGIGQWADTVFVPAKRGVWLVYSLTQEDASLDDENGDDDDDDDDDDDYPPDELVAIHADAQPRFAELCDRLVELPDELPIDNARMSVADAELAVDHDFHEAVYANEPESELRGHIGRLFLTGDGMASPRLLKKTPALSSSASSAADAEFRAAIFAPT